jgi:hypothetical protein
MTELSLERDGEIVVISLMSPIAMSTQWTVWATTREGRLSDATMLKMASTEHRARRWMDKRIDRMKHDGWKEVDESNGAE